MRLGYKTIPTHDIYFRTPLEGFISEGFFADKSKPIRRIGSNCFQSGDDLVIIRYLAKGEIKRIAKKTWRRCFYVIDDDLFHLDQDTSLPQDYRNRLGTFARQTLPLILDIADTIVAPNDEVLASYEGKTLLRIDPCYNSICTDFSHFDNPAEIKLAFLGTRSHLEDIAFLSPLMENLQRDFPRLKIITYLGGHAPEDLKNLERCENRSALGWKSFHQELQTECFHLCLAPALDTGFNRARSINKFFDVSAFGGAGLYSPIGPIANAIKHNKTGLLIERDLAAWDTVLRDLLTNLEHTKTLAMQGAKAASMLGSPDQLRSFWAQQLGLTL